MGLLGRCKQALPHGHELRWLPLTFRSATLGGLFGGGFGGAGSLIYGPLAAPGNVLGVRVMTVEPEPKIVELRGAEAMALDHTYGTNGIVLELEVALAPTIAWTECQATFNSFDNALELAARFARAPVWSRNRCVFFGAPAPNYMESLAEYLPKHRHAVIVQVAPESEEGFVAMVTELGGSISNRRSGAEVKKRPTARWLNTLGTTPRCTP